MSAVPNLPAMRAANVPTLGALAARGAAVATSLFRIAQDPIFERRQVTTANDARKLLAAAEGRRIGVRVVSLLRTALEAPSSAEGSRLDIKLIEDVPGLLRNAARLRDVALDTDVLVLLSPSTRAVVSLEIKELMCAVGEHVERVVIGLSGPSDEAARLLWAQALELPIERVCLMEKIQSVEQAFQGLSARTDLEGWRLRSLLRRLSALRAALDGAVSQERERLQSTDLEIDALEESLKRGGEQIEGSHRRLAEYVGRIFEEYTLMVARTPWESASLDYVLLRDPNPRLDPRPIADLVHSISDFHCERTEPLGVPPKSAVVIRDSVLECRLSDQTVARIRSGLKDRFAQARQQTIGDLTVIRTAVSEWARRLPARWPGPWEDLNQIEFPVFVSPELDERASLLLLALDEQQRLVEHGIWHRIRQSRAVAGMGFSFVTFIVSAVTTAMIFAGTMETQQKAKIVGGSAIAVFVVFIIVVAFNMSGRSRERDAHHEELAKRFRRTVLGQLCRQIQEFEDTRVAAIREYLRTLQSWLLRRIDTNVTRYEETALAQKESVSTGRAYVESRRRALEGIGAETLSRRMADASKELEALKAALAKREQAP